ncbi:hypothetical protein [Marininema halotolerans]|uniref:Stage II sporulation protein B n=1 Tax=Marininema halotolerans TaxID=1155944 RepID=A0A1I6U354_9BACL|nr:hypothetical protein [Marininema halotolerans]SFS95890.1 hypothetical protein SAMN05444972_11333 [Marininema halotolerans]
MEKSRITVRLNGSITGPKPEQTSKLSSSLTNHEGKQSSLDTNKKGILSWPVREVDEDGIEWGSPYSRKRTSSGKRGKGALALSVGAAVVIGTLMGVVILSLFFPNEKSPTTGTIDSHVRTVPSQPKEAQTPNQTSSKPPAKKAEATMTLPKLEAVLIQRGIFKQKSGASKTVMTQRTQGLAAVMTDEAPYHIYQAVAQDQKSAKELAASLKTKGGDLAYKAIKINQSIPVPKERSTNWKKSLPLAIKEGNHIFQIMVTTTTKGVSSNASPTHFKESRTQVNEAYTRFTKVRGDVEKELPTSLKTEWSEMVRGMDLVVQSSQTDTPNRAMFWQMQEGLVRYVLAYQKFVEALS